MPCPRNSDFECGCFPRDTDRHRGWGTIQASSLGYYGSVALILYSLGGVGTASTQAPTTHEEQVALHFRAGQLAFQAGELDRAVEEYKKVLRLDPALTEARVNLGLAYHSLGRYDEAITEFQESSKENPRLLPAHLFLGIDYLNLGLNQKAAAALHRALEIDPANREALRALAAAELAQGHLARAADQFRAAFRAERNQEEAWFGLGHGYLDMVKLLAASLSSEHQASAWSRRWSADLWSERQAWNDASREYQRAIALDPRQGGLHAQLGAVYLAQLKTDEAEAEFQKEFALDPHQENALLGMAEAQLLKGAASRALEAVTQIWDADPSVLTEPPELPAINLTPDAATRLGKDLEQAVSGRENTSQLPADSSANLAATAAAHFLESMVSRAAGDAVKAQAEQDSFLQQYRQWQAARGQEPAGGASREACQQHRYTACVQWMQSRNPRTFGDNVVLGQALLTLRDDERASDAFAQALAQQPTNPAAIYWLLRSYRRMADRCFAQLAELFPDSWRVHQMKAEIYLSSEQYNPAIQEYQLALEKQPGNAALHGALGGVYLKKKSVPEAKVEIERALQLDPTAAETLYLKGDLCLAERKPAEGIPYLQRALRRDPRLLAAHAALGKAYLRVGNAQLAVPELEKSLVLDHYGDLHFLLSQAYSQLGKNALAQQALARSQEMRKVSAAADQAKLAGSHADDDAGP